VVWEGRRREAPSYPDQLLICGAPHISKDHRPDLRQMILAVLIDGDGRTVCSEMWPGNAADVTTLIPLIERLRRRFDIARVCVVADGGMITAETVAKLEARQAAVYPRGARAQRLVGARARALIRVPSHGPPAVDQAATAPGQLLLYLR
jgi:hypothetical protein